MEIRYVGKTQQKLSRRYNLHIHSRANNKVATWIKSLKNQNLRPIIEVLDTCTSEEWIETEQYWIAQLSAWGFRLTNITPGGDSGSLGYKHTNDARNRIGLLNSRPKSQEWISNATAAMTKVRSTTIIQLDLDENFIREWESFCFAGKSIRPENHKAAVKNIHACCNNKRRSAYGFKWKYKV